MPNKKKPHHAKIAILTSPEGHYSIATAIQEILSPSYTTTFHSIRDSIFNLYTPIYQFFPTFFRVPYALSQYSSVSSALSTVLRRKLHHSVSHFIDTAQPDLIICTNAIFLPTLEALHKKNHIPIINVIADPRTIHPLAVSERAETNLVFDEHMHMLSQTNSPDATYDVTGWFVRQAFSQKQDTRELRTKLKLIAGQTTILVTGGSEGTMMVLKLIPALLQLKQPVNVIVLCGNNKNLVRSIKSLVQMVKSVSSHSRVIPVGFTTEMPAYLAIADLVIGKAGPNTIFETIAAKKPFIAITHITGQEDGNLELIREYKLGFVEENPLKVVKLLQSLLDHPARLTRLQAPIAQRAALDRKAGEKLLTIVERVLKT